MNVYIITECYGWDDCEIIKVFETEEMARDFCRKRYDIESYTEDDPYIENLVVYYKTKNGGLTVQRFGVQHNKI